MERGRKSRRGRYFARCNGNSCTFMPPQHPKTHSLLNNLYSFFIMSTLMALIYLMLQYHCQNCRDKGDMNNISKNLEDISKNLSIIKHNYNDMELKISQFSQKLPVLEGQISILETLATSMEKDYLDVRASETTESITNVDNKHLENKTESSPTNPIRLPKQMKINQD